MGDRLKNLDKRTIINIAGALILGIILLVMSSSIFKPSSSKSTASDYAGSAVPSAMNSESEYTDQLEKRLEEALSLIEGAGKVKVMLTLAYGRVIDVAEDKTANESITKDTGTQGGERTTQTNNVDSRTIILTGRDGVSAPLVIREAQPKIEGVIIIAEGGDNIFVKQALTNAAEAVLGLDMSKIHISKMKS